MKKMKKNKSLKILIIGNMLPYYKAEGLARGWEKLGHEVFRISTDEMIKLEENTHLHQILQHSPNRPLTNNLEKIDLYNDTIYKNHWEVIDFDFIFVVQNDLTIDFTAFSEYFTNPIYYWQTQPLKPAMPMGLIPTGIFYASKGMEEQLRISFPYQFNTAKFVKQLMLGYNSKYHKTCFTKQKDRKHLIGFKGHTHQENGKESRSYLINHCYDDRNFYLENLTVWAEKSLKWDTEALGIEGSGTLEQYNKFLEDCSVAFNVPSICDEINDRYFHYIARGCVLLCPKSKATEELGLVHLENCLLFEDGFELLYKMNYIHNNPELIDELRLKGLEWVKKHSYENRAKQVLEMIK